MNERKHLAERILDFIDVSRIARAAAEKAGADIAASVRFAVDCEVESLEFYLDKAWLRIHRLREIAECAQLGKKEEVK